MIYNKIHIAVLLVILTIIQAGTTTAQLLTLTGNVYDEQTLDPVSGHPVKLELTFQGTIQTYDFITNNSGVFGDSIPVNSIGSLYLWTLDCMDSIHSFSANFDTTNNFFSYDFYICTDSIPVTGCENSFDYVTTNGLDFTFTGYSSPVEADYYSWDFGDGETGSGKIVSHSYNVNAPAFYAVTLTTIILASPATGDSCVAVSSQEIEVGGQTGCANWFEATTMDYITYSFQGFSDPEAQIYLWDFGDGNSGNGQNTIHTFDPNNGNTFTVTLTTIYTVAGTIDTCVASSQQTVIVSNNTLCQAGFYFIQDSINELQFHFFDNSTGLITIRTWNFGDGTTSGQLNPVHQFPGPGNYTVCLAVESDSLGIFCSDTSCQLIEISLLLHADFAISLDTLSGLKNNYIFSDNSSGMPESWQWDFGDGEQSTVQSPVHQYSNSGEYEVCLQVTRNYPNFGVVTDSHCEIIATPEYLDFGGQVFLDNYPLNNYNGDTTVVDTGIAYLYRKYYNAVIPVDTNIFYQYGYYWFSQERAGDYIIKIGLSPNSEHYHNVLTTYYQNSAYWNEANTLHLAEANNYFANVDLKSIPGVASGPGNISGTLIVMDNGQPSVDLAVGAEIILADENENMLAFTSTDENGNFSFANLALTTYKLRAELTGLNSTFYLVELNSQNPISGDVMLEAYNILGINENSIKNIDAGNVYPNPVHEHFTIEMTTERQTVTIMEIYSVVGQKMAQQAVILNEGKNSLQVDCSRLSSGVYILRITTTGSKSSIIRKFVK